MQKTVNGVVTNYTLHGKNVVHMTSGGNELHFFYDAANKPAVVVYNGTAYAYVKNLQGDIIAILDQSGNAVVQYVYDAWGRPISCSGTMASTLGVVNPFRYRGYVYDQDTGMYYLRSRYYAPTISRFINSDTLIQGSLYNYCCGNPINRVDYNGKESIWYVENRNTIGGLSVTDEQYKTYRSFLDQYSALKLPNSSIRFAFPPYQCIVQAEIYDVCYETETVEVLTTWGHICSVAEDTAAVVDAIIDGSAMLISAAILSYAGYYIPPEQIDGVLDCAENTAMVVEGLDNLLGLQKVDHFHTVHTLYVYRRDFYYKSYSEFLIIFSLVGKCRFSLIFQAIPAFLLTEDTRHNPAFSSLTRQSKVVKV